MESATDAQVDEATETASNSPPPPLEIAHKDVMGRRGYIMAKLSYREAVAAAIAQEMRRDSDVVFLGEDIAAAGGVFKTTVGLLDEFGPVRSQGYTDLRTGHTGRNHGCCHDRFTSGGRDHVF